MLLEKELAREWADTPLAPRELYQEGNCCSHATLSPEAWFPGQGMANVALQARVVCHSCPVQQRCLEWALEAQIAYGIWGGTNPGERKRITKSRVSADPHSESEAFA